MSESTSYFIPTTTAASQSTTPCTWIELEVDSPPFEVLPGLQFQPILGQSLAMNIVRFEPNTVAPLHSHEEEQISLVLEGELEFEVNGETRLLGPNTAVVIPPHAPHAARTHGQRCLAIDAFHPPRQGLAEMMRAAQAGPGSSSDQSGS